MKKLKWSILSLAVIVSICGAFATRPHFDCSNATQYALIGGVYTPAGTEGVNYVCSAGQATCTYYTVNGVNFFQCQAGTYCTGNCFVRENGKTTKPATTPSNDQKSH